jgi:uncharacterized protein YhaN
VRFVHLSAITFGPLRKRELELDSDIVLVHGPNEAGKSSFRAALETILFGFKPAERDLHPLAQWNPEQPDNLQLESELRLDTGEIRRVERILLQIGKSRYADRGAAFAGPRQGNSAVSWVTWLSREIFRDLYSLEIAQLAALNPSVRSDVDQLLLPRASASPLRAIADVRSELQRDHLELWRPDNRGKPRVKQLRSELSEAQIKLGAAKEADRALRSAREERSRRESELVALRKRKRALDREQSDAPLLGDLFELNRRRERLGPLVDLSALGDFPLVEPHQLDLEIAELEERLREPRARLEQSEAALDERHRSVLDIASEIERAVAEQPSWSADGLRRDEQRGAARALRERAGSELSAALAHAADEDSLTAAAAVPLERLAAVARDWSAAGEHQRTRAARSASRLRRMAFASGVAGLIGIALGSSEIIDTRIALLGAVLVFTALLAGLYSRPGGRIDRSAAPAAIDPLLGGLRVSESLIGDSDGLLRLVRVLDGVQRLHSDARGSDNASDAIQVVIERREREWATLCRRIGADPDGAGDLLIDRLRTALESAREQDTLVRRDRALRDEAKRLCDRDAPLLERKSEHRRRLGSALQGAVPDCDSLEDAFERVRERQAEHDFLARRELELREDSRFAAFEADPRVAEQRAPEDAPWLPEMAATRDAELRGLEEQIGAQQRRLGELSELLSGDTGGARARATDTVREIEEQLETTERERDRLALLDSILGRAEREFRESHQPDVLRRASSYLEKVTLGRYRRLDLLEQDRGLLCVTPVDRSEPIEVGEPISQGTLDQIFFCLRLGMLDHLDEDRERLPLLLDDALLRMDDTRRHAVYDLLADIAPDRQIFLLTCHGSLAEEISAALKVRRIDL